ncbi:MAG: DNA polymerase III subunit gamma/tau [Ferrimonas sp.]
MSYQVLARKWRPANFEQVVGQEHVLKALSHALQTQRLHHAYLFTGTRGVGKTSIARLLAKGLNCEQGITATPCGTCDSCQEISQGRFVDLIEIDAASRTKVDDTREILDNVQYQPVRGRFKVYLIDEVHMLSRHSFNALLKTLEEPPEHVKFLLATTDPQKLPVTVLSRCLQFNLKSVLPQRIAAHLEQVLEAEQVPFDSAAVTLLAQAADGSVRDAMSLTDQAIAHGAGALVLAQVQAMLGTIDNRYGVQLLQCLCQGDPAGLLSVLDEIAQFAPDHDQLLQQLALLLHHLAFLQFNLQPHSDLADNASLQPLAQQLDREQVQLWYQIITKGRTDLALAPDPRSGFEMVMLRALAFAPAIAIEPMQARQLEPAMPMASIASATAPIAAPVSNETASVSTTLLQQQRQIEAQAAAQKSPATAVTPPEPAQAAPLLAAEAADPEAMFAEQQLLMAQAAEQLHLGHQGSDHHYQTGAPEPTEYRHEPTPIPEYDYQGVDAGDHQADLSQYGEPALAATANSELAPPAAPTRHDPMQLMQQILQEEHNQRRHLLGQQPATTLLNSDEEQDTDLRGKVKAAAAKIAAAPSAITAPKKPELESLPPWYVANDPRQTAGDNSQPQPEAEESPRLLPIGQRPAPLQPEPEVLLASEPEAEAEVALPLSVPRADDELELDELWYQSLAQLPISARPKQLAMNSVLNRHGEQVVLHLQSAQQHLNHDSVVAPLQQALEQLWQTSVQLQIVVEDLPHRETPLALRQRHQQQQLLQAQQNLRADPVVIWLQTELAAKLLEDSISCS